MLSFVFQTDLLKLTYYFDSDCFGKLWIVYEYTYRAQEFKLLAVQAPHPIPECKKHIYKAGEGVIIISRKGVI